MQYSLGTYGAKELYFRYFSVNLNIKVITFRQK